MKIIARILRVGNSWLQTHSRIASERARSSNFNICSFFASTLAKHDKNCNYNFSSRSNNNNNDRASERLENIGSGSNLNANIFINYLFNSGYIFIYEQLRYINSFFRVVGVKIVIHIDDGSFGHIQSSTN